MVQHGLILGLLATVLYACILIVSTEDAATEAPATDISCRKIMTSVGKKQFKIFGQCSRDLKKVYKTKEELSSKIQCVVKCMLERAGLLNEVGKLTNETLKAFMDSTIPEEFHEVGFAITSHCIEENAALLDPTEELCTSYGVLVKCLQDTLADYAEFCH